MKSALYKLCTEIIVFTSKQARACVFAGSFFFLLFLAKSLPLGPLAPYDFLFITAIGLQIALYFLKIETKDEIKTIALFHILGLLLELYKTSPSVGSWPYPGGGVLKIATVPLFSGFMYAAVGSYLSQAWRIMKVRLTGNLSYLAAGALAIAIYINFFTNHILPDFRWLLIPLVFVIFWKVDAVFTVTDHERRMPISLSFLLIAFFIWIAENISTFLGAWKYPHQLTTWDMVSWHKISSWYLLVIISFILIAQLKHAKRQKQ